MMADDEETPSAKPAVGKPLEEIQEDMDSDDEETKAKKSRERTFWTRLWQGLAGGSIGLAIAAIAIEQSVLPIVAGIIAVIVGAAVIKFQFDLQDTDSLRRVQNLLRKDVNRLQEANNRLDSEVDKLQVQCDKLDVTEKKLQDITAEQGTNVNNLVALVKENGEILEKMKANLKAEATQMLMSVVLSSDVDGTFTITGAEVDILMLRMKNVEGITFHEDSFRRKIEETDGSVGMIVQVVKDLHSDDVPEEEQVFELDVNQVSSRRLQ